MGGTVIFAVFAAVYFWWPKVTGRMLSTRLATIHFWLVFVGFNTTFFVMHILGRNGMPRRVADYAPDDGFIGMNQIATIGAALLGLSVIPFLTAIIRSLRTPPTVGAAPSVANSLELATNSPPPDHNLEWLPPIPSERPVFRSPLDQLPRHHHSRRPRRMGSRNLGGNR